MHPLIDPFAPIPLGAGKNEVVAGGIRHSQQRARRSEIRATIRRMLADVGCQGVTVRGIAEASGSAVQTVYNMVGPRDQAISEAISEYSIYVGRLASPALELPIAIPAIANRWVDVTMIRPGYSRQCNMIFFSEFRHIYYRFRERQLRGMNTLLRRQQQCGILRSACDVPDLAELLVLLSSSMWVEWADRPYPIDILRRKLNSGFANLLTDKLSKEHGQAVLDHLAAFGAQGTDDASTLPLIGHGG